MTDLVCRMCGLWFGRDSIKGPTPRWCGRNCKQRAYRARTKNRAQRAYIARRRAA